LIKLIYPDGKITDEELAELVSLASEFRQRVHNQLTEIAPGEFKPRMIGFVDLTEHTAQDLRSTSKEVLPQDDRLNREAVIGAVTGLGVISRDGVPTGGCLSLIQVSAFSRENLAKGSLQGQGLHGRVM